MEPCVVVTNSCQSLPPSVIIKGVLKRDGLSEPIQVLPEIQGYTWEIDNKYYSCRVTICSLAQKSIGSKEFAESVNAIIIPFDAASESGLQTADQWLTFTKEFDAEICILVCDKCLSNESNSSKGNTSVGTTLFAAQTWCVENGFELVELNPEESDENSDTEDDFKETTGIERIIQALHSHMWPNLALKDTGAINLPASKIVVDNKSQENTSEYQHKLIAEVKPMRRDSLEPSAGAEDDVEVNSESVSKLASSSDSNPHAGETNQGPGNHVRDDRIDAVLESMDAMPEEKFEDLFRNLSAMKLKAESLSPTQRKEYAEQMAVSFWKSIGGHDSEIEGLSSDDD